MSLIDKSLAPLKKYLTDLYVQSIPLWQERLSKVEKIEKITKIAVPIIIASQVFDMFFRGVSLFKVLAIYASLEISKLSSTLRQFYQDPENSVPLSINPLHHDEIANELQLEAQTSLFQAIKTNSLTYKLVQLAKRHFI